MTDLAIASDGLPARLVKSWSHEKLFYVERYLQIFCTGMKNKWDLVYADLLAGPGLCIDLETRKESEGSPLLATRRAEFCRLFLNDRNPIAAEALRSRTANQPSGRVQVEAIDCNSAVDAARTFLFPQGAKYATLGLAVVDPTAFQMSYDSLARLTADLKLDLIVVFMSDFIRRFIGTPEFELTMNRFYGSDNWRGLLEDRNAGETVTYRRLLDLYEQQLNKLGYLHLDDSQRMTTQYSKTIYHLIFASKHPRGTDFFKKISKLRYNGQRYLL
jgi:three-Cys-motif partner protein